MGDGDVRRRSFLGTLVAAVFGVFCPVRDAAKERFTVFFYSFDETRHECYCDFVDVVGTLADAEAVAVPVVRDFTVPLSRYVWNDRGVAKWIPA